MQFHLNGFKPGDPELAEPATPDLDTSPQLQLPAEVDVLIVGSGPAGLTLASQLAAFPDICTQIVEQKPGRLILGQADGIACRTMEMFEAFGFSERVLKEACRVNETVFWKPDDRNRQAIVRASRVQDVEDGLSEFPHVVLNQARVHDFYLDVMWKSPSRLQPVYSRRLTDLQIDATEGPDGKARTHPVTVRLERTDADHAGEVETVTARYVVGCDGARSAVRTALGRGLRGDSANQAWGVMDMLAVTDFPDIRLKCLIQSHEGSIVLIPREGGYLVRIYVELDALADQERATDRNITLDDLIGAAQRVFRPYSLEVKEVPWWSVYEIGQRLCDKFDDVPEAEIGRRQPRVFIAGDACHTHSPKAGQGMNVSMQDSLNLGWKLAAVLRGQAQPHILDTYTFERQTFAKELIDFDREWARMLSQPPKDATDPDGAGTDPTEFRDYFIRQGRFTAGTATRYAPSIISARPTYQDLATGLTVGMRFHSAPVIRLADACPVELGHTVKADGRWRLFAFVDASDPTEPQAAIRKLCDFLANADASPVRRFTPPDADIDAVIDVRAIFQQHYQALAVETMPTLLLPQKGRYGLRDYEKMFCPDLKSGNDIFAMRGIDRTRGCMVIVRPDQFVANVLPLNAHDELSSFFAGFMVPAI